jgi:hypothetical protein
VRGNAALNFYASMMLDPEQWELVLQVYAGHPVPALTLAYQLIEIKQSLKRGQKGIQDAIAGLDLAVEALYPHTDFYSMGRTFFSEQSRANLNLSRRKSCANLG